MKHVTSHATDNARAETFAHFKHSLLLQTKVIFGSNFSQEE